MVSFILACILPALVVAQYDTGAAPTPTSVAVPSPSAGEHIVTVSTPNDVSFIFSPNVTSAKKNENVTFIVVGGVQHSITQSSFDKPCTPLQGGFNSGFLSTGSKFTITINDDTQPIYFYCMQTTPLKHCGLGMVGIINQGNNTFDNFRSQALSIGTNEPAQTATAVALAGVGASAAASPTAAGGATHLTIGVSAILAGIATALYTLA
jgi:plastocyanin